MRRVAAAQAMQRRQSMRWAGSPVQNVWHGTRPVYRTYKQAKADRQLRDNVLLVAAWAIIVLISALAV